MQLLEDRISFTEMEWDPFRMTLREMMRKRVTSSRVGGKRGGERPKHR